MTTEIRNPATELGMSLISWVLSAYDLNRIREIADQADMFMGMAGIKHDRWDQEMLHLCDIYGPLTERQDMMQLNIRCNAGARAVLKMAGLRWNEEDKLLGLDAMHYERFIWAGRLAHVLLGLARGPRYF